MKTTRQPAIIAFSDGTIFGGECVGFPKITVGEAVFNTAICGYQEIISDPSYHRQIVNFTHPHIGNVGTTSLDDESSDHCVAGIIARKISEPSSWRAKESLATYLYTRQIMAIDGVDTRTITLKLRDQGALAACIAPGDDATVRKNAVEAAAAFAGLGGAMLAAEVSDEKVNQWTQGLWYAKNDDYPICQNQQGQKQRHLVVLDCGVKQTILRQFAARGCQVTVLPYDSDLTTILSHKPDGVVFSNGPGDPAPCKHAEELARQLFTKKMPLLGICLGHQIIASALGAKTIKMKFGHHGANHPVRENSSGRVLITSQNHGFAVDADSLPTEARVTHVSLFDGSLQGIAADNPPLITFQGHPEASPGPHDAAFLFDDFITLIEQQNA
ncbi:MAG: glutamine-hydrolyzing carbamoyl-phosphate synthase small subunit [Gammaproteobacteria bacterium WSBS_2016_MAG_OTU1]